MDRPLALVAQHRRALGVTAFTYALVHFLTYAWLDQGWVIDDIVADVIKRIGGEVSPLSRSEFIDRQNKDRERYGKFIKEIGLKVE